MLIKASIPVEMIKANGYTTYRHEIHEVKVIRVLRYPATRYRDLNRWHYEADISDPPQMCSGAVRTGVGDAYRVRIDRQMNPRWKPPVFQAGANVVEIQEGGAT